MIRAFVDGVGSVINGRTGSDSCRMLRGDNGSRPPIGVRPVMQTDADRSPMRLEDAP